MNEVAFLISPNKEVEQIEFSWSPARNIGMHKIVSGAVEFLKEEITREYKIYIATADFPLRNNSEDPGVLHFDMVTEDPNSNDIFPLFSFGNWIDMRLEDWDEFVSEIQGNNHIDKIQDNRLFWSGSCGTSTRRQEYLHFCHVYPKLFHGINMSWIQKGGGITEPVSFTSWKDHCKYKYLLDIQGYSWGSRLKFIPYCNRPLFAPNRKYLTWSCIEILKQKLHVPVAEDFSDLPEKYEWAEKNQDLVFSNAKKLLNFCLDSFSFKNVCKKAAKLIKEKIESKR